MDNLRLPLSLALAFIVFLMWQAWEKDYGQPPVPRTEPVGTIEERPDAAPRPDVPVAPATEPETIEAAQDAPIGPSLSKQTRVKVHTDLLAVEIDTNGADIRVVDLLAYPVSLEDSDTPFRFFSDSISRIFVAQTGLIGDLQPPTHHSEFTAFQERYELAEDAEQLEVPFVWKGIDGLEVRKIYTFHKNSYLIDVRFEITNGGPDDWSGRLYGQFQRTPPGEGDTPRFIYTYTGAVLHSPDNRYEKISFDDMASEPLSRTVTDGWLAMIQHYFGAAWIPVAEGPHTYYTKALSSNRYAAGVVTPTVGASPGETAVVDVQLYAGPKERERLVAAASGLELTVDYGYLTIIAEPLYWLMDLIHGVVGNWGWAIVILTILIKLAFFHLSATSYRSMARMRKMQPRLMALKERYGDDRTRLNQAMMDLYKTEKINPLGGCLPILVQIPVFIALYWVLLESVELRQAPFMLWIKDLATNDPYFVLPLLMGATMLIQQKLNPAPMDPIQQKVMMILPIVFTVFFLFFPAGLVLYWVVNNGLSIAQQWVITRRIEKDDTT